MGTLAQNDESILHLANNLSMQGLGTKDQSYAEIQEASHLEVSDLSEHENEELVAGDKTPAGSPRG